MNRFTLAVAALVCAIAFSANAAGGVKKRHVAHQRKALRKELVAKYDLNKDGKLQKREVSKMSKEDKQRWRSAVGTHKTAKHKKGKNRK